jgi:Zn-dependent M28 family amino/carboxypeptidase
MSTFVRRLVPLGVIIALTSPLSAQSRTTIQRAAGTIDAAHFRAGVGVIADDSMRGRDTPSPELEKTAAWVAAEFRRLHLRPAGDQGSYLQRFQLRRSRPDSAYTLTATGRGVTSEWRLGRDIAFVWGELPEAAASLPVVLLAGVPTDIARPLGDVPARGAVVIHVITPDQFRGAVLNPLMGAAMSLGVGAWIVVVDAPAPRFAALAARSFQPQWELLGRTSHGARGTPMLGMVNDSAARAVLAAAGEDLAALRTPAGQGARALAGVTVAFAPRWIVEAEPTAPNVVGVLEGSDPTLRNEAVVFVGHMDHVGVAADGRCPAVGADSTCNGADDNASGTVGVVELAEAYASLQPRPRRSIVFLGVSAEERGLFGTYHYTDHPAIPLEQTVAAFSLDMLSRNAPDTIYLVGKRFSSLGEAADRTAREHPELRMTPADDPDSSGFNWQSSDHLPFAQRGVPAAFFFAGQHPDLHRATDSVDRADWDKAARVARLAFYLGLDVANAAARPQWDPAARQRIVAGAN